MFNNISDTPYSAPYTLYSKKAFTLIELIVVIAIIAVLAAIIAPNAFRAIEKAKVSASIADFKTYKAAIHSLHVDTGHWISDDKNNLSVPLMPGETPLDTNPVSLTKWGNALWPGWDGPYIEMVNYMTQWGGTYFIAWNYNFGREANSELFLEFEDCKYPCGPGDNEKSPMPEKAAIKIDETIDDGNLSKGDFRAAGTDYHWIMYWDYKS